MVFHKNLGFYLLLTFINGRVIEVKSKFLEKFFINTLQILQKFKRLPGALEFCIELESTTPRNHNTKFTFGQNHTNFNYF
ncbi:hypothetical protein BWK47_15875 [Synechocystis sp. CACIAM 05]|nr:hypothetical protein BWK47_15875 [Synechocystis sp. CACIAM 05]